MDKDLASAIVQENCGCYMGAIDAAKKVLINNDVNSENALLARRVVKSVGEELLKQHYVDKAMECYQILTDYAPTDDVCADYASQKDARMIDGEKKSLAELGPNTITVSTTISSDVNDIFQALGEVEENKNKDEAGLLREAVFLLILKYANDKTIRQMVIDKLKGVILE